MSELCVDKLGLLRACAELSRVSIRDTTALDRLSIARLPKAAPAFTATILTFPTAPRPAFTVD